MSAALDMSNIAHSQSQIQNDNAIDFQERMMYDSSTENESLHVAPKRDEKKILFLSYKNFYSTGTYKYR